MIGSERPKGYLSLILHAHLPFVRHPEYERFFEESWLFEAILESYVPLLQLLERWDEEQLSVTVTVTLSPTLCAMLCDPLLQQRTARRLNDLVELTEKEVRRTKSCEDHAHLAQFYLTRFVAIRDYYLGRKGDLITVFRALQERGRLEIMTCAATHSLLPLMAHHFPSMRAQILIACDYYQSCFGCRPRGIWLPECAYAEAIEPILRQANLRWFITDAHGISFAQPRPRWGAFAPILTPGGLAAFGRDKESARQVWSRDQGYPADPRYRDFYRDIGFDLPLEYMEPCLPAPTQRGFTGLKYYRVTNHSAPKESYDRNAALQAAAEHAWHFLKQREIQMSKFLGVLDRPPVLVCPYDAELFGHWWYEGPEFLDSLVRGACSDGKQIELITPEQYLNRHPNLQLASPAASSWGQEGYWRIWLNDSNAWIYPHLNIAQQRMSEIVAAFPDPDALQKRALEQAARELLLAQASDWPFILASGTNTEYAAKRVQTHLLRFTQFYEQLSNGQIDSTQLESFEKQDNIFPELNYRYFINDPVNS